MRHPTAPGTADVETGLEIAVIGMSCRFPGAADTARFWENIRSGTESITVHSRDELLAAGVSEALLDDPDFVPAQGVLEGADLFDADFFGINPKEADLMDPQHRLLLECAWQAIEDAGYDPRGVPGPTGVYAGSYYNTYVNNLDGHIDPNDADEVFARNIANEKDYLATRIAYKLDLDGPAVTVQTACSTSLVAVHLACQALLSGSCDTALAGGVTVRAEQTGYVYQPGGIFSADGHCRPFDASAQGTVAANGAGVVVLKRLRDALADGDPVRAVIKGSAIGNDGAGRVGFTAPGVAGQARVVQAAWDMAEADPATASYVEAHGSATPVGDPIEIEALTRVFAATGAAPGACAIGSVKGNIGHTHAASGIAGLIKTVLALQHRQLPPSLHFDTPNPAIDFGSGPFRVHTRLTPWQRGNGPRRAGVSSFGMGGTGAHVVLEEAPPACAPTAGRGRQVLPVSARTAAALDTAVEQLADRLEAEPPAALTSVARTLQEGRHDFTHRRLVVARDPAEAAAALRNRDPRLVRDGHHEGAPPPLAFLLPGLGEQRPGMGRELYDSEPVFRAAIDLCADGFRTHLGRDLRQLLYPERPPAADDPGPVDLRRLLGRGPAQADPVRTELDRTLFAQPATFAVEYALARLWQSWGVRPDALIGYSLGEYVAACLAGVLSLDDALLLVAHRARLIDGLPEGAMLAVPLPEEHLRPLLGGGLSLAAVNGPALCVVAGTQERIGELQARLTEQATAVRRLRTTHAFHSHLMAPLMEDFAAVVAEVSLHRPAVPYVSTITGDWVTGSREPDRGLWVRHLVEPVRFAEAVGRLWAEPGRVLLEVGPGRSLSSLALQARAAGASPGRAFASLPGEFDRQSEEQHLLGTAGSLWAAGVELDWAAVRGDDAAPPRVPLPTYPFQRRRHWIAPRRTDGPPPARSLAKKPDLADWFHVPVWEPLAPLVAPSPGHHADRSWLLFTDDQGAGEGLAERLTAAGHRVTTVRRGTGWCRLPERGYRIDPASEEDYRKLVESLYREGDFPQHVVHLWSVGTQHDPDTTIEHGFSSILRFNRAAVAVAAGRPVDLTVVTSDAYTVLGNEQTVPEKATAAAVSLVLPLEQPESACRAVDISLPGGGRATPADTDRLLAEVLHGGEHRQVALRGRGRWTRGHRPVRLETAGPDRSALRHQGVYLLTGGLGGMSLAIARHLAETVAARLVLVGRSALPPRESWDEVLAQPLGAAPVDTAAVDRVRAVRELEDLGAEVMVVTADVTDQEAMEQATDAAVARFGAVHGIVHAAGLPGAGLAQLKDIDEAQRVLAPKIHGGRIVDTLARRLRPDFTVLCSSTLALTGGIGQVDYVAANAFLDALAHHTDATGGPRVVSVNWDGWQESGMAARLIGAGAPEPGRRGPVDHPLLGECLTDDGVTAVYRVPLSVADSWLIDEHRMAGNAVVPGTGHLELVRAAYEHQSGSSAGVELTEVTFLAPVVVGEEQRRELRIVLDKQRTPFRFTVAGRETDATAGTGTDWQVHVTGRVGPAEPVERRRHDVDALIANAAMRDLGAVEHTGPMGFGPRSRCLRRVHLGATEALAELELPAEFAADLERVRLHPSLLDLAAGFHGMNLAREFRIPLSYGRLVLLAPLPRRIYSHHRFRETDLPGKETFTADFTLLDETGLEVARVDGFVLKRVAALSDRLTSLRDGTSQEVEPYRFPAPARPAGNGPLRDHLEQGILPSQGVEALLRVLASDVGPQIAVVAKDLDAVAADIARGGADRPIEATPEGGSAHPRPGVASRYQAPRDEIEDRLAALWAEMLGLDRVGVHDNFFELGGHSLLGLQLVARIRRRFGADLPLSALFDALTVAELASSLRTDGAPGPDAARTP
ncbi:type I polyketide synthase [Streptomyces fagopyri]|uniref:type I polyketide synthase n=1 Tax=Streptomyces fagopyri TaxID=2662397 RepID=UPI00382AC8E6